MFTFEKFLEKVSVTEKKLGPRILMSKHILSVILIAFIMSVRTVRSTNKSDY